MSSADWVLSDNRLKDPSRAFRQTLSNPCLYRLVGHPGSYHKGAGNVTFADGHTEPHKWLDPRTKPPLVPDHIIVQFVDGVRSPGNPDVQWIQQRTFQKGD